MYDCFLYSVGKTWIQKHPNKFIGMIIAAVTLLVLVIGCIIIPLIIAYSPSVQPDPSASGMAATN